MSAEREALEAICACYPKNSNAHRIASQALANPATGDDALRKAIERALAHRYGDWMTILENALASSPAEPREASGYCPFCMTADPVAPAEGDEPTENQEILSFHIIALRKQNEELLKTLQAAREYI